ncbi:hypothetical protein HYT32_01185 [Candidatus Roizmanbacteria bacterium]|nr:hypothetical protein [Candidatus Roizmanbacteria bacterium]
MKLFSLFSRIFAGLTSLVLVLFVANPAFASNFYLSSDSADITLGDAVVPVRVVIDTKSESVNGISAFLRYPNDKLEVAWISYGEAFPIQAAEINENGIIEISRGSIEGEVGNVTIATIGFKGISEGEGSISFTEGSAAPRTVDSTDSLNLEESVGKKFTIKQSESNIFVILFQSLLSLLA